MSGCGRLALFKGANQLIDALEQVLGGLAFEMVEDGDADGDLEHFGGGSIGDGIAAGELAYEFVGGVHGGAFVEGDEGGEIAVVPASGEGVGAERFVQAGMYFADQDGGAFGGFGLEDVAPIGDADEEETEVVAALDAFLNALFEGGALGDVGGLPLAAFGLFEAALEGADLILELGDDELVALLDLVDGSRETGGDGGEAVVEFGDGLLLAELLKGA